MDVLQLSSIYETRGPDAGLRHVVAQQQVLMKQSTASSKSTIVSAAATGGNDAMVCRLGAPAAEHFCHICETHLEGRGSSLIASLLELNQMLQAGSHGLSF